VTCSWCEERFERFIDGLLYDAERARLVSHVDGCANCSGLLEELRVVDALLLGPRTVELPEDFTSATMADVREMALPCARHAPITA
jgi:anti-sigma factor RsiW